MTSSKSSHQDESLGYHLKYIYYLSLFISSVIEHTTQMSKTLDHFFEPLYTAGDVPEGYSLTEGEDGYGAYNPTKTIKCGRRHHDILMALPERIWVPWIRLWVTALEGLQYILDSQP